MLLHLIKKEFLLEFRQKSTIGGVLVYVVGTVFVSALCFKGRLDKPTWNALFWVITLFTSVTISGKSFLKETGGQALFNFFALQPAAVHYFQNFVQHGFYAVLKLYHVLFLLFFY